MVGRRRGDFSVCSGLVGFRFKRGNEILVQKVERKKRGKKGGGHKESERKSV